MQVSPAGLAFLASEEGIVPAPYKDSAGIWTWGIGHTAAAGDPDPAAIQTGMPADMAAELRRVVEVFQRDVRRYAAAVSAAVRVPLAQHEFDALVSWHFNTGAVATASLVRDLNAGRRQEAADGFRLWRMSGGRVNPGLVHRRERERQLFLTGDYQSRSIIIYRTDSEGKRGAPCGSMATLDFLDLLDAAHADDLPAQPESGGGLLVAILRALERLARTGGE